ncbi:MAG TPA: hypothetical protein VGE12_08530 [Noviherbaspirillum sp.]
MAQKMAVLGLNHKRGRLSGQILQLQELNTRNRARIEALHENIAENNKKIAALTSQLDTLAATAQAVFSIALPPALPRKTAPKHKFVPWGELNRQAISQLKQANGIPLTTLQVAEAINQLFKLNLSGKDLQKLRVAVKKSMGALCDKGVVRRVTTVEHKNTYRAWVLADFDA